MNKKYKFTGESREVCLHIRTIALYRIQALRSFDGVEEGDVGGWIEKEENLSHERNCWVDDEAQVFENAEVFGNARVNGNARVFGNTQVFGNARVNGNARVFGNARVYENARVCENAGVFGDAFVNGDTLVCGNAQVCENAWVCRDIGNSSDNLPEELNTPSESIEEVTINLVKMKHKIGIKEYSYECGDGCCDEHGKEWYVDGELVHGSPCEDSGWLAVFKKLGIDVQLVGLDENNEEIWSL